MSTIKSLKQLNEVLVEAGSNFVLIDFYANWCGPCKVIAPKVEQLIQQLNNLTLVKVNVDESEEIVEAFEIGALPTFVIIKSKKRLETFVGSDFDKLKEMVLTVVKRKSMASAGRVVPGPPISPQPMCVDNKQQMGRMAHGSEALPPGQVINQHSATRITQQQSCTRIQQQPSGTRINQQHSGMMINQHHSGTRINQQHSGTRINQQHSGTRINQQHSGTRIYQQNSGTRIQQQHSGTRINQHSGARMANSRHDGPLPVEPPKVRTPFPGGNTNKKRT